VGSDVELSLNYLPSRTASRQYEAAGKLGLVGLHLAFSGTALVEGDFY
jgi:hypothetical protein